MSTDKAAPNVLEHWSEAELLYFPVSPRVIPDADPDPVLEVSIGHHFDSVAHYGISKVELAKEARRAGIALQLTRDTGKAATEKEIDDVIKAIDSKPRIKRARRADDIRGPMISVDQLNYDQAAPESKSEFKPGLFIIYGGADAGKTYRLSKLFEYIRSRKPSYTYEYLIMGEPDHRSLGSWQEIIASLRYGFIKGDANYLPDVMFVDSLKDLIYMPSDSGSGSGGLSTETITVLSSFSSQLMKEGRTVIAVINPSQPKYTNDMYETLKSNVTGIFYYNPVGEATGNFKPTIVGKLKSSLRAWSADHYERKTDMGIMNLLGLEGDILDAAPSVPSVKSSNKVTRVTHASNLRKGLSRLTLSMTPSNENE